MINSFEDEKARLRFSKMKDSYRKADALKRATFCRIIHKPARKKFK